MKAGEVATLPERLPETLKAVHIFADEGHVHMQDGTSAALPLVTACTGKKAVCAGRDELADRVHLGGYGLKSETFWEHVYAVCDEKYGMAGAEEVFVYGDGAKWIEAAGDCFPNAVRVLDAYHYEKKMKALTAGEVCGRFAGTLRSAVSRGGKGGFGSVVSSMAAALGEAMAPGKEREKKLRGVSEAAEYLLSRWDTVMNMGREGSITRFHGKRRQGI